MKNINFFLALAACTIQAHAQLCFTPPDSFAIGNDSHFIISDDFNGDGKPDLATANAASNDVTILLGTGAGSFGAATSFSVGSSNPKPSSLCSADFNGDGKKDLAVGNGNANYVSVLLGTGAGSFGSPNCFTVTPAGTIISADFNGDGLADLAIAYKSNSNVFVLLGTGSGSFGAATPYPAGGMPISIMSADFNGDGFTDLATANGNSVAINVSNSISVLLGTGTGSFGTPTSFSVTNPISITSADFNGDGFADIATANQPSSTNNVSVLLGTGTGSFGAVTNFGVGYGINSITNGDFDGDGKTDLAVTDNVWTGISILLGTGTGSFAVAGTFPAGGVEAITAADFNADGKTDLATPRFTTNKAYVILNCAAAGMADFTNEQMTSVYPNPASNQFFIETSADDKLSVDLYDINGKHLFNKNINNRSSIDVTDLNEGVYSLSIKTATRTVTKKLVIIR